MSWVHSRRSSPPAPGSVYPIDEGYGYHSASVHPDTVEGSSFFAAWQTRIWVPANKSITKAAIVITTAAVGTATLAAFAVYADDGQSKLGQTPHDEALFLSTGYRDKALTTPVDPQSAGRFVRTLVTANYSVSSPSCAFAIDGGGSTGPAYNGAAVRTAYHNAMTSFPESFDPATGAGLAGWTPTNYLPVIMLG